MNNAKKIKEELKWYIEKNGRLRLQHSQLSYNYSCLARTAVDKAGISKFINALAVFIKQKQAKERKVDNIRDK